MLVTNAQRYDVAVIGAGIAGLAASVLLRRAGLSVVCLDAHAYPHRKVGESLDWSSPGLLERVGIDVASLITDGIATYKKNIVVYESDGTVWPVAPPPVIRRWPMRFETVTLHVDRTALDMRLFEQAQALGATFVWDRVSKVEMTTERVTGCATASGQRVDARWYLDASGTARVLSRALGIPTVEYGCRKVCLWSYFDTPALHDGTAFFMDNRAAYLNWVWDIPISPTRTSVGFVLSVEALRERRSGGTSVETIFRDELSRHARYRGLLDAQPALVVERTSFQPCVTAEVSGTNWLMVGEAASMPDPLTGNGVTSAIRHARHATDAILAAGSRDDLDYRQRRAYRRHVFRLGHGLNAHIETAVYRHPLRWGLGLRRAIYVYTIFAFFMNALHARVNPRGPIGMAVFGLLFVAARAWIAGWTLVARAVLWGRRPGLDLHGGW